MAREEDNPQEAVPATRPAGTPERRRSHADPRPMRRDDRGVPMPEFLSLTYTLPHHLVQQVEDLARETNRSPSEVLADSFRLYLQVRRGVRRRARVSTVNGFAYQEVELAEAVVDEETLSRLEPPPASEPEQSAGPPVERVAPRPRRSDPGAEPEPGSHPSEGTPEHEPPSAGLEAAVSGVDEPGAGDSSATPAPPQPDPGWAALASVRGRAGAERASRDGEDPPEGEGDGTDREAERSGITAPGDLRHGPAPDEDAAEEIRSQLTPLAAEPLDSDRLRRVLEAIMRRVDRKDYSPPDHSRKVAALARRLGRLLGLEGDDLLVVELAGLVHDIGKACVPDELIRHVRLTREEMSFVRRYPEMGASLLDPVPALEPVASLVVSHQERWDGSGYPEGREGSQIPLGAQIVAVCDVYDTLITERRYRPAYDEERAVQIIRENVGRLWSPEVGTPLVKRILTDDTGGSG